jgi:hypothetical protein
MMAAPAQADERAKKIPAVGRLAVHPLEPGQRSCDVHSPIRGVGPARRCGMKREQPSKERETHDTGMSQSGDRLSVSKR